MATKFWVGGAGSWSDTTHWATSTGGAGSTGIPATGDSVTFDGSSGGGNVVCDVVSGLSLLSLTAGAFTGTLDFTGTNPDLTLTASGTALNLSGTGARKYLMGSGTFTFTGTGTATYFDISTTTNLDPTSVTTMGMTFTATTALAGVSQTIEWGTCNTYIQTDQTGGLPDSSVYGTGLRIYVPAARSVYFRNVTGTDQVVDLSQEAARNRPLSSYTKRTYNGQDGFTTVNGPDVPLIGRIVSVKVNVITPYTGVSSLTVQPVFRRLVGDTQTGTSSFYGGLVDLKTAGERIITPTGVTGTAGIDSGLSLGGENWCFSSIKAQMSRSITGESAATRPEFTIEAITDQGFSTDPVAVVPLRFRLRAA